MRLSKPSPSMIVSIAALVVATSGTSYAAVMITGKDIKNNSVKSADIKNQNLKSKDVKNQSLTTKDIRNRTLKGKDVQDGGLGGRQIRDGSVEEVDLAPGLLDGPDTRWLLVNGQGQIEAQSGGFEMEAAYPVLPNTAPAGSPDNSLRANGNVYIESNELLTNNGIVATMALQNASDQNGDGVTSGRAPGADNNPEFSGEISVGMCGLTGVVACAPPGTNTNEYLVVSPRNSDGTVTVANTRKRFYVIITGDSSDSTS